MSQLQQSSTTPADEAQTTDGKRSPSPSLLHRISTTFAPAAVSRKNSVTPMQALGEEDQLVSPLSTTSQQSTVRSGESRQPSVSGRKVRTSGSAVMPHRQSIHVRPGGFGARHVEGVKAMLEASLKGSSRLQSLKHQLGDSELVNDTLDMRVTHVRESASSTDDATVKYRDQLLFICGCMSLARDFQEYQRRCDSKQREQKINGNIPILAGTAAGHHDQQLPDFVASQAPVGQHEREDVESAVLLGIKIRVVDAIGSSLNLGKGLGLLCAFERNSILSLPTKALPHIRKILMEDPMTANRIRAFSAAIGPWWTSQCEQYQERYSSVIGDLPRRSLQDWCSSNERTVSTRKISFSRDPEKQNQSPISAKVQTFELSTTEVKDFAVNRKPVPSPTLEAVNKTGPTVREITQTIETGTMTDSSPSSSGFASSTPWPCVKELTDTIGDALSYEDLPPLACSSGTSPLPPSRLPPRAAAEEQPSTQQTEQTDRSTPSPMPPCPDLVQCSSSQPSTRCSSRTSVRSSRSSSRSPACSPIPEDSVSSPEPDRSPMTSTGFSPISTSDCKFSSISTCEPSLSPITEPEVTSPATEEPDLLSPTTDCSTDAEFSPVTPLTPRTTLHRKRSTLRADNPLEFSHRRQGLLVSRYTMDTLKAGGEQPARPESEFLESTILGPATITASPTPMTSDPFLEQNPFDSDFALSRPASRLSNRSPISPGSKTLRPRTPSQSHSLLSPSDNNSNNARAQSPIMLSPTTYSRTPSRCATPSLTTPASTAASPTPKYSRPQSQLPPAIPIESKPAYVPTIRTPKKHPQRQSSRLYSSSMRPTSSQSSHHNRTRSSSNPTPAEPPALPLKSRPVPTPSSTHHIAAQLPGSTLQFTDPHNWVSDAAANKPYNRLPLSKHVVLHHPAPAGSPLSMDETAEIAARAWVKVKEREGRERERAEKMNAAAAVEGMGQQQGEKEKEKEVEVEKQIDELLGGLQRQMAGVEVGKLLNSASAGSKGSKVPVGMGIGGRCAGFGGMGMGLEAVKEEGGLDGGECRVVEWY